MKKSNMVMMIFGFLLFSLWSFFYVYRYYPHKLPDFITSYRVELFAKQSKESIDEMLILYEKSKETQEIHPLTYLITVTLNYGIWLDDNKFFINQHPALKKVLIEQLKNAIDRIHSTNKGKHVDMDFVLDFFEDHIKVLEDTTGQVKSRARQFF